MRTNGNGSKIALRPWWLYALFFLSGAGGLIYEVSWTRQLGLLFGNTVYSGSVVLGAYFGGMAIGYWLAARWVTRVRHLAAYGYAEIFAAVWAALIPTFIDLLLASSAAGLLNSDTPLIQLLVRAGVSALLLMPATVALGATLPFMASAVAKIGDQRTSVVTIAYACNVGGAVLGTLASALYLLVQLGVARTSYLAACISLACGVVALLFAKKIPADENGTTRAAIEMRVARKWHVLAFFSGFGLLAAQVLYLRLFSLTFHNSVYTFGSVVAGFLLALTAGSAAVARQKPADAKFGGKKAKNKQLLVPDLLPSALQTGGIALVASVLAFILVTDLDYFKFGHTFYAYLAGSFGLVLLIVLIPVTIMGTALPLIWNGARQGHEGDLGILVGKLTFTNTIGATLGSVATSFVMIPLLGLWGSLATLGALYVCVGWYYAQQRHSQQSGATLTVTVASLIFCAATYTVAKRHVGTAEDEAVIERWESAYGWVDVINQDIESKVPKLQLRQNIHYGLGSSSSSTMEKRQAHLPLLLHPDPKRVLFIGLATGITSGAAIEHPALEQIDVVELVPDVIKAAALFKDENNDLLTNSKVKVFANDGRHHLHAQQHKYDVIVADLFVPWESQTGYLYTVEHYEAAREKLAPNGLFCQWLPLWQVGARELTMIADSFASVFPSTTMWYGKIDEHWTIVGLVGREEPLAIDLATLPARLDVNAHPGRQGKEWFQTPMDLMSLYVGDWPRRENAVLNTDEHPRIEFLTPITAWTMGSRLSYATLQTFQKNVLLNLPAAQLKTVNQGESTPLDIVKIRTQQTQLLNKETF